MRRDPVLRKGARTQQSPWGPLICTLGLCMVPCAVTAGATEDPFILDLPDSTAIMVVRAARGQQTADPAHVELGATLIAARDGQSLAALGPLLPSTRVGVNSRGESLFMVRGASERHVQSYLDGIPLNVPWDERADLSQIPTGAIARISAVRGVGSVLDGPNALAGTVQLHPRQRRHAGRTVGLAAQVGEIQSRSVSAFYDRRTGAWTCLAAAAYRSRDGIMNPAGFAPALHQLDRHLRTNTDLAQATLLLRLGREFANDGVVRFTIQGLDGSQGVAPEAYRSKARFWRYPQVSRGTAGLSLELPWGRGQPWHLQLNTSLDHFRQEIRAYDDSTYTTPALHPGGDYETDCDLTGYVQARVTRTVTAGARIALQAILRQSRHRESLLYKGPTEDYVQRLAALAAEAELFGAGRWEWRGGLGLEGAATPETGDKSAREGNRALTAHTRLTRQIGARAHVHLAVSRRSRFPSLREMFSGALGKFVPNPDLKPERQDLGEVGGVLRTGRGQIGLTAFASYLAGGIEKVRLPGDADQFQRVNLDQIRILGGEFIAGLRLPGHFSLAAHHTILHARAKHAGRWDQHIEDRPAHLCALAVAWQPARGFRLRLEGTLTGRRESADATDATDGLRELPAQSSWNVRVTHLDFPVNSPIGRIETFLRINNLGDAHIDSQLGLPESGRTVQGGIQLIWGE